MTAPAAPPAPKSIFLVSYPKIVFLYPSYLAALGAAIYMLATGNVEDSPTSHIVSLSFLVILAMNLVIVAFDFPRTTSLTLFFFMVAVGIGLWTVFKFNPDMLGAVSEWFARLNPQANSSFYIIFFGFMSAIYLGVFINRRFDYWEVRPNELLHHHGVLSNMERFSAPNLRISKEINDVFEYLLLRSGRLILQPSQERRAIVLDNVFFISNKEAEITKMLSALQVQVRPEGE